MRSQTLARWMLSVVLAVIMLVVWLLVLNQPLISQGHPLATDYTVGGVCGATIQACIDNPIVQPGDRILIPAGTYTESLTLNKAASLIGADANTTVIHAVNGQRVITVTGSTITATTVVSGLTFTGGRVIYIYSVPSSGWGGAMWLANAAEPLIENVIIVDNQAAFYGGGIFAENSLALMNVNVLSNTAGTAGGAYAYGPITLTAGQFQGNRAPAAMPGDGTGGGIYAFSTLTLSGTEFIDNTGDEQGGGAYVGGLATLINGRFVNNGIHGFSSTAFGGGIFADSLIVVNTEFISNAATTSCGGASANSAIISSSRFEDNHSAGNGGALCVGPTLVLSDTDFISNSAQSGGAVYANNALVTGGRFENNIAPGGGGAVYIGGMGNIVMTDSEVISNSASAGSGGVSAGTATLIRGRFERNATSGGSAGGIGTFGALNLLDTRFFSNTAAFSGGGAYVGGSATLEGGQFEGNQTTNSFGGGGGIFIAGMVRLTGTRFVDNATASNGGAALISGGGRIANALFAHNTAGNAGAALYVSSYPQDLTILHSSIADTSRNPRQGIFVYLGNVGVTDTIIASHTIGIDNLNISGSSASYQDYNLFFGNTQNLSGTILGGSHNQTGDPLFVNPLSSDYHLKAGSAAIDKGIFVGVTTDIEGHSRLPDYGGLRVDIGAYEAKYQGAIYHAYLPVTLKNQ